MKSSPMRITLFFFLIFLFIPEFLFAGTKAFIKEYRYQASEDDSRNSSRVIALREVKRLLLEELGTYLESETEVKNFQLTRDQITTFTAGIVQTEIVNEKWDGHVYWLKAKITADSDKVVQSINELRDDREKKRDLDTIRRKSDELLRENDRLRKELASMKDGDRDAQKAAYDKSIKELSAADWLEKGYAAKNSRDFKGATEAYGHAIELDPKNTMAYFARAILQRDKNLAMQDFNKLLAIEPKDSESYLVRAWTYRELENRDLALQEFGKAIGAASGVKKEADAYYERGMFYYTHAMGKSEDIYLAIQDSSRAIELDPKDSDKYFYRANMYISLRQPDLAVQDFNKAIEVNPKDCFSYIGLGNILVHQDQPALAIESFNKAIKLVPDDYSAYEYRADAYVKIGRLDLAIKDWSKSLELGKSRTFVYNIRADLYARMGKHELAVKDYSKTIELKPNRSAYMDRGKYFARYGKHDQAVKDFTAVIKMKPDFDAYVKRGFSYFKLGKNHLALQDYDNAIALRYEHPAEAYYNRAMLYVQEKNPAKAIQDLTKATQIDQYYRSKAQQEPQFDSLRNDPDFINLMGK